jgi:hypothetical protein
MGPIVNTIIGCGIKIGANLVNAWIDQKRMDRQLLAAQDQKALEFIAKNQNEQAKDPFVKVTRRVLFLALTFTYCFLMVYYALNPDIKYEILVPTGESWGIFGWFAGEPKFEKFTLTGGLLLMTFTDLIFMVVGFYSIPSKRR